MRISALLLLLAACEPAEKAVYEIGDIGRPVTTKSKDAQLWFDRGLALSFGFNHAEAVHCFEQAAKADPDCAMDDWGKAYALGPNYNDPLPMPEANEAAHAAITRARTKAASPVEKALIEALAARCAWPMPEDRAPLDRAYAEAMRKVHKRFPDDADVAALTAEAVMQLRPWGLWTPEGKMAPETPEVRAILEPALQRWPNHVALCHLYIHAMEAGPEVRQALPAARALEKSAAGLGHLVHMPSHIYVWAGLYDDVIRTNIDACRIDEAFVALRGRANFFTAYRIHNLHFVAYGGMWEGRRALALQYARKISGEIPPDLMKAIPDIFDVFVATPYHVMVRFGMWKEILAEKEPPAELLATRAVWRYARGVALAALGRVAEAEKEQALFRTARDAVPESRLLFQNPVAKILGVADVF
ncbi:MAG: hypothetical protein AAGD14_03925, partial [Planctomycetota bacterium]